MQKKIDYNFYELIRSLNFILGRANEIIWG